MGYVVLVCNWHKFVDVGPCQEDNNMNTMYFLEYTFFVQQCENSFFQLTFNGVNGLEREQ